MTQPRNPSNSPKSVVQPCKKLPALRSSRHGAHGIETNSGTWQIQWHKPSDLMLQRQFFGKHTCTFQPPMGSGRAPEMGNMTPHLSPSHNTEGSQQYLLCCQRFSSRLTDSSINKSSFNIWAEISCTGCTHTRSMLMSTQVLSRVCTEACLLLVFQL